MNAFRAGQRLTPRQVVASIGISVSQLRKIVSDAGPEFPGLHRTGGGQMRFVWNRALNDWVRDRLEQKLPVTPVSKRAPKWMKRARKWAEQEWPRLEQGRMTRERARLVLDDMGDDMLRLIAALRAKVRAKPTP